MLQAGIFGVGHLGQIHLKCISELSDIQAIGCYDPKSDLAEEVALKHAITNFESAADLIQQSEAIIVASPTYSHFEIANLALQNGKHVFIEKPLTQTLEEADRLLDVAERSGVVVQVGHVERFNPAFTSLDGVLLEPMFVEAHRLASFNLRGTDVSVVLDLMIHDIDILLAVVKSEISSISASGVSVVSDSPDIANARIEFKNGCVANLTASRMSFKQMRKMRLFQQDAYISIDFLDRSSTVIRLYDEFSNKLPQDANLLELETQRGKKLVHMEQLGNAGENAIKQELKEFAECIQSGKKPRVGISDGYDALELAFRIIHEIEKKVNV